MQCAAPRPAKREEECELLSLSTPHGVIKVWHIKVDYRYQPGVYGQWGSGSTWMAWARGWTPVNIGAQTETPMQNHRKKKKNRAKPPLLTTTRRLADPLGGFIVSRRYWVFFLFSSKYKTIRPGAVKESKTEPERNKKATANN